MFSLHRKMAFIAGGLVVLLGLFALSGSVRASDGALTNGDVVQLARAGLGDAVVLAKIRQAPHVAFALDVDDMIALKKQGVSQEVIAAMLERSSGRGGGGSSDGGASVSADAKVWFDEGGQQIVLRGQAGYLEASIGQAFKQAFLFSFKNRVAVLVSGMQAKQRFSQAPTVIYTRFEPEMGGVARFTPQEKKNRRYFWLTSRVGSNQAEVFPPEDDMKFDVEELSDGVYKLTFRQPLTPGEYAFVTPDENQKMYRVFDFGVDG